MISIYFYQLMFHVTLEVTIHYKFICLCRQKQQPPTLSPQKHPHGSNPGREVHPHTSQPRPFTYGNDNSSVNRQSRTQTTRPVPIPGLYICLSPPFSSKSRSQTTRPDPIPGLYICLSPSLFLPVQITDNSTRPHNRFVYTVSRVVVFNTTFNNISIISWQSVLLVEETRVPRENH